MLRATKIRIYPTDEQADFLNQQFGAVRFVYNRSLHIMSHRYKVHAQSLKAKKELKALLPVAKKSRKYFWLKEFDSIALQQACINLDKAFANFFDKSLPARYPVFKRRHGEQSSYHCMGISIGDDWIKIPKLSPIKAKVHRSLEGKLKSITLKRTVTGKYYASVLIDTEQAIPEKPSEIHSDNVIGLDMGLTHVVIDSNGNKQANPRFLKRASDNLRRKQRKLSRKQKGSANRGKARLMVAKCHERVANARNDFQHKLSRQLVDENQVIAVETLKVKNMLKNRKLAKHIADVAWGRLIEKIDYKAEWKGVYSVHIDTWFPSSKTHNTCGHVMDALPLSVRSWDCPACGAKDIDRDLNAALNIKQQGIVKLKAEGHFVSAHGGLRKTDPLSAAA